MNFFKKIQIYFKNNFYYFGVFLTIIVFIFFMNGEWSELNFYSDINDSKFANFFTCIGAIIASMSLYAIYKQVKQNNDLIKINNDQLEQNRAQLMPFLIPVTQSIGVTNMDIPQGETFNLSQIGPFSSEYLNILTVDSDIEFINRGNGIAKEIVFQFKQIDDSLFKELADELKKETIPVGVHEKNTDLFEIIEYYSTYSNREERVLAIVSIQGSFQIALPKNFINFYLNYHFKRGMPIPVVELPKIHLIVKCKGITNIEHIFEYDLQICVDVHSDPAGIVHIDYTPTKID